MSRTILRTTIAICALAVTTAAASGQTPGFYPVGLPQGGSWGQVRALSQDGSMAAGFSVVTGQGTPGFTWTASGGRYDFGFEPGMPPRSAAYGLSSDGGVIVGFRTETFGDGAYRRIGNGPLDSLGTFTYGQSEGRGVSGDGNVVVGRAFSQFGQNVVSQAFRWTPQTGMQGLGFVGGTGFRSEAHAISRDGSTIVGESDGFGFVWRESHGMQPLPSIPGVLSQEGVGTAVNADGSVVVGSAISLLGRGHAVRWTSSGAEDLGVGPGNWFSIARAVDGSGDVVGGSTSGGIPGSGSRAFIWTPTTGLLLASDYLDLHQVQVPPGWNLVEVLAISGDGLTFAGEALSPQGIRQGFVATVPAPSGMIVVFSSALLVMRRRRRGLPRVPPMGASVPEIEP
jgi:uncharacterized membrane protein